MTDPDLLCGCNEADAPQAPGIPFNRPGLDAIAWRIGTFAGFRQAALRDLTTALPSLTTREADDPAITLIELWAALGDVLTFHQERIANEMFLRTAVHRDSLRRLVRLLDYRPRPGLAAETDIAFTLDKGASLAVRPGLKLMSVPGQDEIPHFFETVEAIAAEARLNRVPIQGLPVAANAFAAGANSGLVLSGPARLLQSDRVLLCGAGRAGGTVEEKLVTQSAVATDGRRIGFEPPVQGGILGTAVKIRRDLRLFGWNAPASQVLYDPGRRAGTGWARAPGWSTVTLAASWPDAQGWIALERRDDAIRPGALLALHRPGIGGIVSVSATAAGLSAIVFLGQNVALARVTEVSTRAVTLRGLDGAGVALDPQPAGLPSETVTCVKLRPEAPGSAASYAAGAAIIPGDPRQVRVWEVEEPPLAFRFWEPPVVISGSSIAVRLSDLGSIDRKRIVLLGDGTRTHKARVVGSAVIPTIFPAAPALLRIDIDPPIPAALALSAPDAILLGNVARASEGETQAEEVLGDGDAARPFQRFVLRKAPITRRASFTSVNGRLELTVLVDDQAWTEVATLFGRGPSERVFVIEEPLDGATAIRFGDGTNGARLPTGRGNVRARYRTGLGIAGQVRAGQLSVLLTRPPGLKDASNPIAASGAADPEDAAESRSAAPRSVRTFGRAVALDDLAALAIGTGLAARARGDWIWSGTERLVHLSLIGPDGATLATEVLNTIGAILAASRDPIPRIVLGVVRRIPVRVVASLVVDESFVREEVLEAARMALSARLSFAAIDLAEAIHSSDVIAALQAVRGVQGVDLDRLGFRNDSGWTAAQRQARDLGPGNSQPHLRLFPARPRSSAVSDPLVPATAPRLLPAEQAFADSSDLLLTASGGIG